MPLDLRFAVDLPTRKQENADEAEPGKALRGHLGA